MFLSVFIFISIMSSINLAPLAPKLIPITQLLSRAHIPHLKLLDDKPHLLSLRSQPPSKLSKSSDLCTRFFSLFYRSQPGPNMFFSFLCPLTKSPRHVDSFSAVPLTYFLISLDHFKSSSCNSLFSMLPACFSYTARVIFST